jgi:thioredoxin reductase
MMMGPRGQSKTKKWPYDGSQYDWDFGPNAPGVSNVNQPDASNVEKAVSMAKKYEGSADILWIRDGRHEHPNSFIQDRDKPFNLAYAEAIKKAGVNIFVCPTAGFHLAAQNDEFIAKGKTDMVGMTTPFFADPELVKKASEGRLEDIIPCLMCHDCHGISRTKGPWYDSCNVNPKWALPIYKNVNIPPPTATKKVAVIGGGPGGMKAAIVAAERGHKVTLYEKSGSLGGLLKFTDHTQWKWTYKDFKDYLVRQVDKAGIEVKLNTRVNPELIKAKNYDTVLAATGAEPVISRMPGADGRNVFNILSAYSNKKALGKNVVMIGAGRIGTEAAIGMAKDGHHVTMLTSGNDLIEQQFIGPHNMMNQILILEGHPNFSCILEAIPKSISEGKVTYRDKEGSEKSIKADSVVIYSGLKPRMDEAMAFSGSAEQVLLLGDCTGKNGTIQKTIRSAFFVASQI